MNLSGRLSDLPSLASMRKVAQASLHAANGGAGQFPPSPGRSRRIAVILPCAGI
jgi:hypothetical protein